MTPEEKVAMLKKAGVWDVIGFPSCIDKLFDLVATHEREKLAEQEPVIGAYEVVNEKGDEWSLVYPAAVHRYKSIPEERITQTFYAAPVRTKDLTDGELEKIFWDVDPDGDASDCQLFARAVIAAYKEKNK